MRSIALCASLVLLPVSCVPDFDTDLSRLASPRLLAIASSPAEAKSEQTLKLRALVAAPEGTRAPTLDWSMCLSRKPLTELGPVDPACLRPDDGSGKVQSLGQGLEVEATIDEDVCKLFGPLRPTQTGSDAAGRPVDPDVTGGFYQPFAARLGDVVSLGAVRVDCDLASVSLDEARAYRQRYRANESPTIAEVRRVTAPSLEPLEAEKPAQLRQGEALGLRATWNECSSESECGDGLCTAFEDRETCAQDCGETRRGCTGAEPYVWFNQVNRQIEPRREGITVAWYASRGHFEYEQTGLDEAQTPDQSFTENVYIADGEPGLATLWLVIRDTRGGQSWQIREVEITP